MKIFIVRHGETDYNKTKRLMGQRINDKLNKTGIEQITALAQEIDRDFDIIFTSPLKRAVQSAEIIATTIKAPVVERVELMERDFGSLSGKTWEEMKGEYDKNNVDFKKQDFEQQYDYTLFGGESFEDVKNRILLFVEELKERYSDKKVLIVAHGGILKMAHFLFYEEKPTHTPDNASLYEFDI